jgi:hypothetical protein
MRRHRWLAPVFLALITLGVQVQLRAQDLAPPGFGGAQPPSYGLDPSMFHSGQAPMYYQPWPAVSPYMGQGQQLSNESGLWQYEDLSSLNGKRRYRFRTEYVRMRGDKSSRLIGHRDAPTYREQIVETLRDAGGGGGGGGGGGASLDDYADALDGTSGFGEFNLYDPVQDGDFQRTDLNGLRLTLEVANPDGTGLDFWGLMAIDNSTEFNARKNVDNSRGRDVEAVEFFLDPINADFLAGGTAIPPVGMPDSDEVFQNNLLNLRGIPLDDGSFRTVGNTIVGGANAIYDLDFKIGTYLDYYSTGLRWKGFKIAERSSIVFRPTGGIRLDAFHDHFRFYGRDSGLLYDGQGGTDPNLPDVKIHSIPNFYDDDGDGIIDNAGLIEDNLGGQGGGGGGGGGGAGTATFSTESNDFDEIYPITSILSNRVDSYLGGPEIGLDYMIGQGRTLRVGGSSTVAMLANHQRIRLSGDNIFVTTRQGDLRPKTPENARPNQFSSKTEHTSVSPLFEQHIYVDGPVFNMVPVLRRSSILRQANVRLGYTYTVIGQLTRAADSIVWQGNPSLNLFPEIQTQRSTWSAHAWNLGVSWAW